MKLQSMNCPNCGGDLKKEGNVLACENCGSTFAIDYDDADVEYEKLSTEDERNRQQYEHEKEMLETQYRLQEEARLKQLKFEKSELRKKRISNSIRSLISVVIVFSVIGGIVYFTYRYMDKNGLLDEAKKSMMPTTTETTADPYDITKEDILADSEFLENAKASILSSYHSDRDGDTASTYDSGWLEYTISEGDPEIYDTYYLVSNKDYGDKNRLYYLIKFSFINDETGEVTEVYDALYLRDLKINANGKITCDFSVRGDRGSGATDWTFDAATDSDQLYRSAILGQDEFTYEKIEIPNLAAEPETEEAEGESSEEEVEEDETEEA